MQLRPLLPLCLACFLVAAPGAGAVEPEELLSLLEESGQLTELEEEEEELEEQIKAKTGDRHALSKKRSELRRQISEEKKHLSKNSKACRDWFKQTGGGDINAQDKLGRTLLMLVADTGNEAATMLLLTEGPKLDILDHQGRSALDHEREAKQGDTLQTHMEQRWEAAFAAADTPAIAMLLEAGLAADTPVGDEAAPVLALGSGNTDALALLLGYPATIKARDREGLDLLELAIRADNAQAISLLCTAGMGKDRLSSGNTPLFHLLTHGRADCLKAYVDACTGLDDAARRALPPMVVRYGTVDMVRDHITGEDTANAEDEAGNIPVHEAARRGDMDILRLVLERGGSRTATNGAGESALMHAALSGNTEVVALVLEGLSDEDINHKDRKGQTAADFATESGNPQVLETLRAAGPKH